MQKFIKLDDQSGVPIIINRDLIRTAQAYGEEKTLLWFGGENSCVIVSIPFHKFWELLP